MCCETDLSGGSAKGSDGAADRLSRRRRLVGPVDFNLLALSLLREHIRAGRKRFHELAPLSSPAVENALWPSARAGTDLFHGLTACQVLSLAYASLSLTLGLLCQKCL